jgi:hypothetical protein
MIRMRVVGSRFPAGLRFAARYAPSPRSPRAAASGSFHRPFSAELPRAVKEAERLAGARVQLTGIPLAGDTASGRFSEAPPHQPGRRAPILDVGMMALHFTANGHEVMTVRFW